jgi:hypothetical protein
MSDPLEEVQTTIPTTTIPDAQMNEHRVLTCIICNSSVYILDEHKCSSRLPHTN